MNIPNFEGLSLKDIKDNLEAECVGKEHLSFIKPLNDQELRDYQETFVESSKKIAAVNEEILDLIRPLKENVMVKLYLS